MSAESAALLWIPMPLFGRGGVSVRYDLQHIYRITIVSDIPDGAERVSSGTPDHIARLCAFLKAYQAGCGLRPDMGRMNLCHEGTDFSWKVYDAVGEIPFGAFRTYQDIARDIGSTQACRAVGSALRRNPFHIVVPCHRVVAKVGDPFKFAAGADMKRALLAHEKTLSILEHDLGYMGASRAGERPIL